MSSNAPTRKVDPNNLTLRKVVALLDEEVGRRHGTELTFEQQCDHLFELAREVFWLAEELKLQRQVTHAKEVEVGGRRYRQLDQPSSATYHGCWGPHMVEEPLYRLVGQHNGPTIKPIELRAGIIEGLLPDMARMVGKLSAGQTSRQLVGTLETVRMVPPSRACLEKRVKAMAAEIGEQVEQLEEAARAEPVREQVAAISCGMDRGAVRMVEPLDPTTAPPRERSEPYERTPPPPCELHYRMAWNGSVTLYDIVGKPLHTFRYAAEADADPVDLARRISTDVAWVQRQYPFSDVHCIQDGAPELRVLPEALAAMLPPNVTMHRIDLVDFEHLMGYLEDVVDACEPKGDPRGLKQWYRTELLSDDGAIERVWRKLRELAKALPLSARKKRKAVAAALSYIRTRKDRMRYATRYSQRLPIGSGDTENTVWLMQQRVKQAGQSWQVPGLRGILVLRALELSGRWDAAWTSYAATRHEEVQEVRCAAAA
jgi:hypothetical protein